ncbi:MAG: tRNA pseudouridine(55) synthase TruB [Longimicrobiales bacterium]|nr:tRNA pseudouridine(55) synthase TruB [Longimicrobiales bacterium]
MDAGDYVLPVDKPEGPTSHDVVAMARKALGTRKIGHTGTLDPFASGLLVLCVGRATRLAEYLTGLEKSYVARARLGVTTDTLDREGDVVEERDGWQDLTRKRIEEGLSAFVGEVRQVPPQFSAKKVGGEAMHRKARRGETVALDPVPVTIHSMELLAVELPDITFAVRCSTGTYVRALARDVGQRLGVGAHLTELRRTRVGAFSVDDALTVEDLEDADRVASARIVPADAMSHLPRVELDDAGAARIRHGQRVPVPAASLPGAAIGAVIAVLDDDLVAVARLEDGVLRPSKVFPA